MKKPANLIYGLNEAPPPLVTLANAIQHVALIGINVIYPLLVFRLADTPIALVANILAIGMLVLGAGTFLQVMRVGPFGSGFMCPSTFTAAYFSGSLWLGVAAAVATGALAGLLMALLTVVLGVSQHVSDQRPALGLEHLAEAVLLRREVFVEGRLRHAGVTHYRSDGRLLVSELGEKLQGRSQQPLPALPDPGLAPPLGARRSGPCDCRGHHPKLTRRQPSLARGRGR